MLSFGIHFHYMQLTMGLFLEPTLQFTNAIGLLICKFIISKYIYMSLAVANNEGILYCQQIRYLVFFYLLLILYICHIFAQFAI